MLYAEVFIYPGNRIGMWEYPSNWRDFVSGHALKAIMEIGLRSATDGEFRAKHEVQLETKDGSNLIPLCRATINIRIHDLRDYPLTEGGETTHTWSVISGEQRARSKRWSCAPTVDEFYLMVDADLPEVAKMGRFLHGNKA